MQKKRIIFFGSGDFPRHTFIDLLELSEYEDFEVVGLVTSNDKCEDNGLTLRHCAEEADIPYIVVKDCNSSELEEWCKNLSPDIFIVISFKKIPNNLLALVDNKAFNIHASLLPLLRGANPIRWAIRLGLNETGVTAIELSDKIDCGKIIDNRKVEIKEDDNYGTLKSRLSVNASYLTESVLTNYFKGDTPSYNGIHQTNCGDCSRIFYASKINTEYFCVEYDDLGTLLRSVAPYGGVRCQLKVYEKTPNPTLLCGYSERMVETYGCTIWKLHKIVQGEKLPIKITKWQGMSVLYPSYAVDEIQIEGKKRMKFSDFANGFKYLKPCKENEKYNVIIELY